MVFSGGALIAQDNRTAAPPPPVPERTEAPKVPTAISSDTTGVAVDPKSYVIGPEDIINIKVWREPDYSGPKGVRPDGKITMPLIGEIQAAGLTPARLGNTLKQALSEVLKEPEVDVEVIQVNSKRYTVTGGVNRPGVFPLVVATHVFEALNIAGGFRDFANRSKIVILRADGKRLYFNYKDFVKGKHMEANILLENGDTILVKE